MEKKTKPQASQPHHSNIISAFYNILFNLMLLTLLSWVLLIAWLGIKEFLSIDCSVGDQIQKIIDCNIRILSGHHYVFFKLSLFFQTLQTFFSTILNYIANPKLQKIISILIVGSVEIILVKSCLFVLFLPLYFLVNFLCVVDGLVQRDIRKYQVARESTFFFHWVKSLSDTLFLTFFFIYMVIPLPISPEMLLVPIILLSGFLTMLSIKNYKKYL